MKGLYVCADLYTLPNGSQVCNEWTVLEQSTFWNELLNLSYPDMARILAMTAALFALAWVWRLLSKQASF